MARVSVMPLLENFLKVDRNLLSGATQLIDPYSLTEALKDE